MMVCSCQDLQGSTYKVQKVLKVSLVRQSYPHRWEDVERIFVGMKSWTLQYLFYWFLDYIIQNWCYLILNNRDFWTPLMPSMARAIEDKLASLPNLDYRLFFPEEVPFTIFGFIDSTMHAMCRPGGGPLTGGVMVIMIMMVPDYSLFISNLSISRSCSPCSFLATFASCNSKCL